MVRKTDFHLKKAPQVTYLPVTKSLHTSSRGIRMVLTLGRYRSIFPREKEVSYPGTAFVFLTN